MTTAIVAGLAITLLVACGAANAAEAAGDPPAAQAEDKAIRAHRTGTLVIAAPPGAEIKVTQRAHEFWFGTALSRKMWRDDVDPEEQRKYFEIVRANFNSAVHENALKWYSTEREAPGAPNYADADRMLAWCTENRIVMRGHCLFWEVEKFVQPWIQKLGNDELQRTLQRRARDVATRYRGRIGEYDVNNEMIHGSFYAGRLGEAIRPQMFTWAHEADPTAILYVNDYNILTGKDTEKYEAHIRGLIAAGAPVGGIGVQGHFSKPVEMATVRAALDRLAKFGLPIKVTEFDLDTDDEAVKARFLGDFYRTCFAHPAVEGILMWGFWEGAHWRPKAALWKKDFTPTPAAKVYHDLVYGRWWTRWQGRADAEGRAEVPAFFGRHLVEIGGVKKEITLRKAVGRLSLDARAGPAENWIESPAANRPESSTVPELPQTK